jgi:predicted ArsR family transcriptional regulator
MIGSVMKNTNEQIYTYIEANGPANIAQISQHLGLTKADIRHHTSSLINAGRLIKTQPIPQQGAGRPAALFEIVPPINRLLVQRLLGGYAALAKLNGISDDQVSEALTNALLSDFHPLGSPAARLNQAVEYLKEMGIQAKWEAGAKGPRIIIDPSEFATSKLVEKINQEILSLLPSKP